MILLAVEAFVIENIPAQNSSSLPYKWKIQMKDIALIRKLKLLSKLYVKERFLILLR